MPSSKAPEVENLTVHTSYMRNPGLLFSVLTSVLLYGCLVSPHPAVAQTNIAIGLTVPPGTLIGFEASSWVIDSFTTLGGANNDLGDGGFLGGQFLRTGNGQANTITLTLGNLPQHNLINISMFVAQLGSVDPNRDGDILTISLDGQEFLEVGLGFGVSGGFNDPFVSNFELGGVSADISLIDAVRTATLDKTFDEHVYNFGALDAFQNIPHTSSTLTLEIVGRAFQGWSNEAYAIDNLTIEVVPEPSTMALVLFGLLGLLGARGFRSKK